MHCRKKTIFIFSIFIVACLAVLWIISCYTPLSPPPTSTILTTSTGSTELSNADTLEMECIAYKHFTGNFTAITANELSIKIANKESLFLFTGRITCEWCRKLVPILSEIAVNNKIEIFYLDSESTESDSQLKDFRQKYNIDFVPSILYFDTDGVAHNIDHEVSSDNFSKEQLEERMLVYTE